jgi:protein tyrosine/serine phosphatase
MTTTNTPVVYGCLFGKDRTGIATSLLLNMLDVHDEYIAADYAKTTHHIQPLAELFRDLLDHHRESTEEELFQHFSVSHESVMVAFLEYLRAHPENAEAENQLARPLQAMFETYREPLKARLLTR